MRSQNEIQTTILESKREELFIKSMAEKFWLRKATDLEAAGQQKHADEARMNAGAANREKKLCEDWVVFLEKELQENVIGTA